MATKRSDQFPLWPVTEGWFGDSRCREEPSASGALPGRDTPFGVSHFAQSSIHLGARGTVMSIRLEERESSQEIHRWDLSAAITGRSPGSVGG